jgi:hypothetical protein
MYIMTIPLYERVLSSMAGVTSQNLHGTKSSFRERESLICNI